MTATRRQFLGSAVAGGIAALTSWRSAWAFYQSPGTPISGQKWQGMRKYMTTLRGVGPGGIPVATTDGFSPVTGATHYSLRIGQYADTLHPALGPTTLWGYSPSRALGEDPYPTRHLGGIIVANKGVPIQLTFTNTLPPAHIIPVDVSTPQIGGFLDAAARFGGSGLNAATVHLHGGLTPWFSDGGPNTWFTPNGNYGPSAQGGAIYKALNGALLPGQAEYWYPNDQSARMVWYHDHAHDITRLNAYAGVASAYIIRDAFEGNLRSLGLPDYVENGGREIPLVVQDKIFVGPNILSADPTWPGPTGVGSLWYPHVYEKNRWKYTGNLTTPDPSCIPEMFGDTMLVNGTVFPAATVEARRYRFRLLNACQARFLNVQLYIGDKTADGLTYNNKGVPVNAAGPKFLMLGAEGGFLPNPVVVPAVRPFNPAMLTNGLPSMLLAPAERADFIVDFAGLAGKTVIVYTDAPAPFPIGDPRNDYYAASGNAVSTKPGYGPDTRILMKFTVVAATSADAPLGITTQTDLKPGLDPFIVPPGTAVISGAYQPVPGATVRQLTLNEAFDSLGRLVQLLGRDLPNPAIPGSFGLMFDDAATETPHWGDTEVWQIANLTGDTHPIHFHLVNVQVLARQPFNVAKYAGTPIYTGPARSPDPTELGWKETVRMNPGEVTTVIMRFDKPRMPPNVVAPESPTGGHEYVWHCHILEHEEHDMMRPLIVL